MIGLQRESQYSLKENCYSSTVCERTWISQKTIERIFHGYIRPKNNFGLNEKYSIWQKATIAFQQNNFTSSEQYGTGTIMV